MLVQLAVSMRAHKRGGVAAGRAERWRELARIDRRRRRLRGLTAVYGAGLMRGPQRRADRG